MTYIPKDATQVTQAWLGAFLQAEGLRLLSAEPLAGGQMSDLLRVRLRDAGKRLPSTLVIKTASTSRRNRRLALSFDSYRKEALFYRQLAPHLDVRAPQCHASDLAPDGSRFALALEDLGAGGAVSQLASASEAQTMEAMRALARLHASAWTGAERQLGLFPDAGGAALPLQAARAWLPRFADAVRASADGFGRMLARALAATGVDLPPEVAAPLRRYAERPMDFLPALLDLPQTLIHSDFRLANLFFSGSGITVIDWGDYCLGPAAFDVALFLSTSLSIERREAWGGKAIEHYCAALAEAGIDYRAEDCRQACQALMPACFYLPAMLAAGVERQELDLAAELLRRMAAFAVGLSGTSCP